MTVSVRHKHFVKTTSSLTSTNFFVSNAQLSLSGLSLSTSPSRWTVKTWSACWMVLRNSRWFRQCLSKTCTVACSKIWRHMRFQRTSVCSRLTPRSILCLEKYRSTFYSAELRKATAYTFLTTGGSRTRHRARKVPGSRSATRHPANSLICSLLASTKACLKKIDIWLIDTETSFININVAFRLSKLISLILIINYFNHQRGKFTVHLESIRQHDRIRLLRLWLVKVKRRDEQALASFDVHFQVFEVLRERVLMGAYRAVEEVEGGLVLGQFVSETSWV